MAAITNFHKLVLKHTFILLQFWRPKARYQFHWVSQGVAGLVSSEGSMGQFISLPFLTTGGYVFFDSQFLQSNLLLL